MERHLSLASPESRIRLPIRRRHSIFTACARACLLIVASQLAGCDAEREESPRAVASDNSRSTAPQTASHKPVSYAIQTGSGVLATYKVDPATGELRRNGFSDAGSIPRSLTISPSGRFAYSANDFSDEVVIFAVNADTGALTITGMAIETGTAPQGVAIHPSGRFAYVANFGSNDISSYAIDARTGALTPIGTAVVEGSNPVSVWIDPDGRSAHVAIFNSLDTFTYRIDPDSGMLTASGMNRSKSGSPFAAMTNAGSGR